MTLKAHIDFETRSAVDLRKAGMHRYAEDPTTEIVCMSWRLGDGPVQRWRPGDPFPLELTDFVGAPSAGLERRRLRLAAHNAGFERVIWNANLGGLVAPFLHLDRQDCTMARAAAMGLPASLENLGAAIDADIQKDKDGHRLMLKMCKPKTLDPLTWHEDPADVERLQAYCDVDVGAECAIDARLPPLSERERRVWELDQRINDRGVAIDLPLVLRAQSAVTKAKRSADDHIWRLTDGAVRKTTEAKKIVDWLAARGIATKSIADSELDDLLIATELFDDETAAAVLALRRASSKAFKFQAMLDTVCRDGRVRGSLAYHGTTSGRWAGRGVQFHNMKRIETDEDAVNVAAAIAELQAGKPPSSLDTLSMAARPMIIAPPGRKLVWGDYSNIEGRLNAWLAGEDWKLKAFRDYDAGIGPDLYKVMAGRNLGKHVDDVTRDDRQLHGKVPELAGGFGGGRAAFLKSAEKAGVKMSSHQAEQIKKTWREENPAIVASWWELQDAAIEAVSNVGAVVPCLRGRVAYVSNGGFLFCRLPSSRVISYPKPTVAWKSRIITIDGDEVEINSRGVSYWGNDAGRWMKCDLYGGLQCAHVVSGTARDVMVEGLFNVEAAGYPVILHIHDEAISEVNDGFGSADEYAALLAKDIDWLPDFPLVAKGEEGDRYLK
jgi:hypothetical protein